MGSSNRLAPLVAPSFASQRLFASTMWMTIVLAALNTPAAEDMSETEKPIRGGSALIENNELTVIAAWSSPASAVSTATPAGWLRKADLKSSDEMLCVTASIVTGTP